MNSGIAVADFPELMDVGERAFSYCIKLRTVRMPMVRDLFYGAFEQCSSLSSALFKDLGHVGEHAFYKCLALETVDLGNTDTIDRQVFDGCRMLSSLILRHKDRPVSLGPDVFINSKFEDENESWHIYVPRSLLSLYRNEWPMAFGEHFVAIEDSPFADDPFA